MYCPECSAEYRDGIYRCPDCEVSLVGELPAESHPDADMVNVFETADVSLLPVVTSLLDAAGIVYMVQGGEALRLLPVGGHGAGLSPHGQGMSVNLFVEAARAEDARALLEPMTEEEASAGEADREASAEDDPGPDGEG